MKKWLVICGSILLMILLVVRLIITANDDSKEERSWYVNQLHFNISGEIDSIKSFNDGKQGRIFFHLTKGSIEKSHEKRVNKKLKHNEYLRFLFYKNGDEIYISIFKPDLYLAGDSIRINTDANSIRIYREGKEISNSKVLTSLRVNRL
ncbi:hypothetical protein BH09BAC3_BH09BAC3_19040 [soil metagenome]